MNNSFKTTSAVKLSNNNYRSGNTMFQAETPKEEAKRKIIATCKRDAGKYIAFPDQNVIGLFVGAVMLNNWPHFVLIDKDRKPAYVRSDETFTIVKVIPGNLSILDYLLNNQQDFIQDVAEDAMNVEGGERLSDVTIMHGVNRSNTPKNNKFKKPNKHNKK